MVTNGYLYTVFAILLHFLGRRSYSCTGTCYRQVCANGYTGSSCSIPICFGSTSCPNGGTCQWSNYCACRAGFSSPECTDVNECASSSLNQCDHSCTNTHGSYSCTCMSGYRLLANGHTCYDIDECAKGTAGCEHTCTNTIGSFQCSCRSGYELSSDEKSCKDIDECTEGTSGCQHKCVNTFGSFLCSCDSGFQVSINGRTCTDVDECLDGSASCDDYCENTVGSYKCGCSGGYELTNHGMSCEDINECSKSNGDCGHICVNEPGRYHCECKNGFKRGANGKTCLDIDECTEGISGCPQTCQNTLGSFVCSCDTGYELQTGLKTCSDIDDCDGVICQHGGSCRDGFNSYLCFCLPGYTSAHCETDVNECLSYNGWCQEVCINTEGSYKCGCYDDRTLQADGLTCPGGDNPDGNVFERYKIGGGLLPKACFVLPLTRCKDGTNISIQLTSTSEWYRLIKQPSIFFTLGITFVKVNTLSLPISIRGLEVISLEDNFNLNHGVTYNTEDGSVFVSNETTLDCKSLEFVESDIFDFISYGSFFRTMLVSLFPALPNWISFDKSSDSVLSTRDLRSDLVYGKDMDDKQWCDGAPVIKDHVYTTFTFDTNFSLSVLGEDVKLPVPLKGNKFCLIVDLCHAFGGSVFLMIPAESRKLLENVNLFQQLKQKYNLEILPRGIGISLAAGINTRHHNSELKLWNGDTTFNYPVFARGDVWISGDVLINKDWTDHITWIVDGNADVYINVPSLQNMLTSIFDDEWNAFIDIRITATLKIKLFSADFDIKFPEAAVESYASIGGKDRLWCGEYSNPPGIFLSVLLEINPFKDVPLLKDWVLRSRHIAYIFATYEPQETFIDVNVKNDVLLLDESVDRIMELLNSTIIALDVVFKDTVHAIIFDIINILNLLKSFLQDMLGLLESDQSIGVKRLLENTWVTFVNMETKVRIFFYETEFILQDSFLSFKTILRNEIHSLKSTLTKSMNEISNSLMRLATSFTGFGLKYTVDLKIMGLDLGTFDVEFVHSSDNLLQCSRFHQVKDILKGEKASRFIARAVSHKKLNFFLQYEIGGGIGGAFSINSSNYYIQMQVFAHLLGMKATVDLFITSNGLYIYIEGNIWDIFLAQVEISAESGKDWNALSFRVKGKFVAKARKRRQTQTVSSSFQGSYLDGLKRVINFLADWASKRLSQVQASFTKAQNGLSKAQAWIENAQTKVRNANVAFDKAIEYLETAKDKLEAAKQPFEEAIRTLEAAQKNVDSLCKIRSCRQFCIPGIKCRICFIQLWIIRIPVPCCSFTNCMIKIPDPFCILANIVCRIIRAAAFVLLEVAKIFVRVPMIVFEAAKVAVSVAQIVVDKSRIVLFVAEGILEVAQIGLEFAKGVLEAAKFAIEVVKIALGVAAKVLEFVIEIGLKTIIDVKNCGFDVNISTKDLPVFAVFCDVNPFRLSWVRIGIKINFKNIALSVWNAARATIDALIRLVGNIFGLGRRRREVQFKSSAKMHANVLRKVRDAERLNTTQTFLNESIDISDDIAGLGNDIDDDYESRVLLFKEKCQKISVVMDFMRESFDVLHTIVNESKQSINQINSLKDELQQYTTEGLAENMTLDNMGISKEYAESDYNMTDEDLAKALDEAKEASKVDPLLREVSTVANFSMGNLDDEMESMGSINFLDTWLVAMKNITEQYFNQTECADFKDCVLYAVSILYELYEAEEVPDIDNISVSILEMESVLIELFQNETQAIPDLSIAIDNITGNVAYLYNVNPFCSVAPVFLSDLNNQTVLSSSKVELTCNTTGDPYPQYWWLKNAEFLLTEHQKQLTISSASTDDSGVYQCISGNVVANITSNEAYLSVFAYDVNECGLTNGGCEHLCRDIIGSYECSCHAGYQLNQDKRTCSDINECLDESSGCAHNCTNTEGSYQCVCMIGFVLHENGRECLGKTEDKAERHLTRNIVLAASAGLLATAIVAVTVFVVRTKVGRKVSVIPEAVNSKSNEGLTSDDPFAEVDILGPNKKIFSRKFNLAENWFD